MTDREKSQHQTQPEPVKPNPGSRIPEEVAADELSIDELEHAAGGTDAPPPAPDPNASC
jgi:hypothetical protein